MEPDFSKTHYLVRWEIDEWADSPQEAAFAARKTMLEGGFTATIFSVKDLDAEKPRFKEVDIEVLAHKVSPDHPDHPWKQAARRGDWKEADRLLQEAREAELRQWSDEQHAIEAESSMDLDAFLERGGRVHLPDKCQGEFCVVHNPSKHHMRDWPRVLRSSTLVERTCPHGVGHPDPDSLAYFLRLHPQNEAFGVHGCDGCCI